MITGNITVSCPPFIYFTLVSFSLLPDTTAISITFVPLDTMRIEKQRSVHGFWMLLLTISWLVLQHSSPFALVAARSPAGSGTSKGRLTASQNRDHSSNVSSKTSRAKEVSRKIHPDERKFKSSSRQPSSVLKTSRRDRKLLDDEAETYQDNGPNTYDLDEDREEHDEPDSELDEEDIVDYELEMEEDEEDIDARDTPRRKKSERHNDYRDSHPRRNTSIHSKKTSSRSTSKRVVPYARPSQPNPAALAFTRGIAAIRESIPDASALRETALSTLNAAKETTGVLTANLYREVKGLTSSELEQVMLKATRPDDSPAKGKHVERLVGVTYQISARYDIYDAVLRKLWSKMCEKDWRTSIKALYVLHRFSADGAPDHQPALKARLRELRRTKDPKRKEKYFNTKQLLSGDSSVRIFKNPLVIVKSVFVFMVYSFLAHYRSVPSVPRQVCPLCSIACAVLWGDVY